MSKVINHILVVDDDDKIRDLLKDFLIKNNFLVTTAIHGDDALQKLSLISFDVLILDIMMSGIDGYELTKIIRSKSLVPIIHLTAMGDTENVIQGEVSGILLLWIASILSVLSGYQYYRNVFN